MGTTDKESNCAMEWSSFSPLRSGTMVTWCIE